MKIQLKRSNVIDDGAAKEPTAAQMEYGELAVNYSESDPAVFIKDSDDNIIRIAGKGATGLDGDYVNVTGDNMTGDLTLGTDKITLNATDGSGTFEYGGNSNAIKVVQRDGFSQFTGYSLSLNDGRTASVQKTRLRFKSEDDGTHIRSTNQSGTGRDLFFDFDGGANKIGIAGSVEAPSISLNSDGNVDLVGNVTSSNYAPLDSTASGYKLNKTGFIGIQKAQGGDASADMLAISTGSVRVMSVLADGSSTFGSSVGLNDNGTKADGQNILTGRDSDSNLTFYVRGNGAAYFGSNIETPGDAQLGGSLKLKSIDPAENDCDITFDANSSYGDIGRGTIKYERTGNNRAGALVFGSSPNGSSFYEEHLRIANNGDSTFAGNIDLPGNLRIAGGASFSSDTTGISLFSTGQAVFSRDVAGAPIKIGICAASGSESYLGIADSIAATVTDFKTQLFNNGDATFAGIVTGQSSVKVASSVSFNTGGTRGNGQNSLVGYGTSGDTENATFIVKGNGTADLGDGNITFNVDGTASKFTNSLNVANPSAGALTEAGINLSRNGCVTTATKNVDDINTIGTASNSFVITAPNGVDATQKKPVFRVANSGSTYIGNQSGSNVKDTKIVLNASDGSAVFANGAVAIDVDNAKPRLNLNRSADLKAFTVTNTTGTNTETVTFMGNGDATFTGSVSATNITAFKIRMASAVASAADLSALKQAILDAVADL